jgi:hypothetical protein
LKDGIPRAYPAGGLFCCRRAVIVIPSFEIKTWMDAKAAFQGLGSTNQKK